MSFVQAKKRMEMITKSRKWAEKKEERRETKIRENWGIHLLLGGSGGWKNEGG